jgi:hypothetical protein
MRVPSAVGEAEPEGHDDDGDNPQEVEGEPQQTADQSDGQHGRHHGGGALLSG